jgi:hypothetical protein
MSLLGDIFSLWGAGSKRKAIDRAASVQTDAANQGIGTVGTERDRIQALLSPYGQAGDSSINALMSLLGLGSSGSQQTAIDSLKGSPLYQSLYRTGEESVLQNASATGGLRGGNVQGSLYNLGSDTLAKVIQNQVSNLFGLGGLGLQGIGESGAFGARSAEDIAQLQNMIGQIQAGGILGKEGQTQNMIGTGGHMLETILNAFSGGGAPGGGSSGLGFSTADGLPF